MDQVMIDDLKRDKEQLREALKNTRKKKDQLYKVSLEYKKLCEEEMHKNNFLVQELSVLESKVLDSNHELRMTKILIQQLASENEELKQRTHSKNTTDESRRLYGVFTSFFRNLQQNNYLKRVFKEKVGYTDVTMLKNYSLEEVVERLTKFTEEILPLVHCPSHKKHLSYDERAINPLFITNTPHITIKKPPNSLSKINEDLEKAVNSSKNIIKSCMDSIESGSVTTRSNFSSPTATSKPKVKIYRRPKSMSQLV